MSEYPKMVYGDKGQPVREGVFYKIVADADELEAALADGYRLTVDKPAKKKKA